MSKRKAYVSSAAERVAADCAGQRDQGGTLHLAGRAPADRGGEESGRGAAKVRVLLPLSGKLSRASNSLASVEETTCREVSVTQAL